MARLIFWCARCDVPLSSALERVDDLSVVGEEDAQPLIPHGRYMLSAALLDAGHTWSGLTRDEIIVNLRDVINIQPGGTRNGCCGVDGLDGINTFCVNGHPIGTEKSDCWMPHFMHIPLAVCRREDCRARFSPCERAKARP